MLLFAHLKAFLAIFSIIFYPIFSQELNCTDGENCDCDNEIYNFWEDFEFTTPSMFLLTTNKLETTKQFITTEQIKTTTTSLETTRELLETTINEETTENSFPTKEMLEPTTNKEITTNFPEIFTTLNETLLETSTFSTTKTTLKTSFTTEYTKQITTIPPFKSTNILTTKFLSTENIQTTSREITTNAATDGQNTTIFATTQTPCGPCQVNQSLMLYDKNILNSNQSINNVPASRCDNCNQSTISQICYNPRPISVVRIRCTDSSLFCVCASNQQACYTVTQQAPLYVADYLIYANASYSFLALNTGASEISNGKKTFEFSPSMTFIPNKSTFLNAPFLSVSCSGCNKIQNPEMKTPYTC